MSTDKVQDSATITKEDFTLSSVIDEMQPGDTTIDIVGYVTTTDSNFHTSTKSKFKKFLCNNDDGRIVQVIAWNKLTQKIGSFELGTIVHASSLKYNTPNREYNKGNVPFELQMQDNSEITVYGTYEQRGEDLAAEEVSILEAYDKIQKKIKIKALLKTEPAIYTSRGFVSHVASITDVYHQLELNLKFSLEKLPKPLKKGITIEVVGTMEVHAPGPAVLRVDSPDDIVVIDENRVAFKDLLQGFQTKNIHTKKM